MKNKRILYAASSMSHIERFHSDYIIALKELGAEVTLMAHGKGADIDIPFEKRIFSVKNLRCLFNIRRVIKDSHFDIVIFNTALAAFLVRAACGRKRPKTLYIVHGFLFREKIKTPREVIYLMAELLLRKRTDSVIVMNGEDLRIARKCKLAKSIFTSRGMGCEIKEAITSPEHIRREFFGEGRFVMCFVGELSRRKNQRFLIKALAALAPKIPSILLCLVGGGEERENLARLSRSLGVSNKVLFVGERRDACDFIRASDLYVSASSSEGLPFNVTEALGLGKTVIISDVKGHRDIMYEHTNFLFKPNNLIEFVNKTCQFYDKTLVLDKETARKISARYSKESVLPTTLEVIKEALK